MESEHRQSNPAVFVLNDSSVIEQFHENLLNSLDLMDLTAIATSRWSDAEEVVASHLQDFGLVIVDPFVTGFCPHKVSQAFGPLREQGCSPKLITIAPELDQEVDGLVMHMGADDCLAKYFSIHDVCFVINQLLKGCTVKNQRVFPRALVRANVEYRMEGEAAERCGETFNLSEGGLFLHSFEPARVGTRVTLSLHLPDIATPIDCHAEVMHSKVYSVGVTHPQPSGMGLKFLDLVDEQRQCLRHFVIDHLPAPQRDQYGS